MSDSTEKRYGVAAIAHPLETLVEPKSGGSLMVVKKVSWVGNLPDAKAHLLQWLDSGFLVDAENLAEVLQHQKCEDFLTDAAVLDCLRRTSIGQTKSGSPAVGSQEVVDQSRPSIHGNSAGINCPIEIKPGNAMGPLRIGMSLAEIERTKLAIKPVRDAPHSLIAGKFNIGIDEHKKLQHVEAELADLPDCIFYMKHQIPKTLEAPGLAKLFANCGPEERLKGGNLSKCDGIDIRSGGWGGGQKSPALKIVAE